MNALTAIDGLLQTKWPDIGRKLSEGASPESLIEFKKQIALPLPETFYALYAWRDGATDQSAAFDGFPSMGLGLLSLREIIASKRVCDNLLAEGTFADRGGRQWWDPSWVPFLSNHSYDELVIDTAGSFGGVAGQLVLFSKDGDVRRIINSSLDAYLTCFAARLEADLYVLDGDGFHVAWEREPEAEAITHRLDPGFPAIHQISE